MAVTIARWLFGLLMLFEALNFVRILRLTVVYTWFGLIITVLAIWLTMELTHRRRPHRPVAWFLALIAVAADAAGDIFKLYDIIPHYDKYMHFSISGVGVIVVTLMTWRYRPVLMARDYLLSLTSIVAVGALYELEEFWESAFFHTNRWGGGSDSMTDMTANMAGALLAFGIVWFATRPRTPTLLPPAGRTLQPSATSRRPAPDGGPAGPS